MKWVNFRASMDGCRKDTINIVSWGTQFIIVHELLHSLGLFHEQSRPDRDTYVDVASLCNNVQGGCMSSTYLNNFPINPRATAYGYYDFDSVMHYGQCSFSRNPNCPTTSTAFPDGGITVRVKAPYNTDPQNWQANIGQRMRLSELDRLTVSLLYPRPNWRFVDGSSPARPANGTFLLPYTSLQVGIDATPAGGVLWIQPGSYRAPRTITKSITLRAPLGGVTLLDIGENRRLKPAIFAAFFIFLSSYPNPESAAQSSNTTFRKPSSSVSLRRMCMISGPNYASPQK